MSRKQSNGSILRDLIKVCKTEVQPQADEALVEIIDSFRSYIYKQSALFSKVFGGSNSHIEDLQSEGISALINAVRAIHDVDDKFDGAIVLYLNNYSKIYIKRLAAKICPAIKIPDSVSVRIVNINAFREKMLAEGKRADVEAMSDSDILEAIKFKKPPGGASKQRSYDHKIIAKNARFLIGLGMQRQQQSLNDNDITADSLMTEYDLEGKGHFNAPDVNAHAAEFTKILRETIESLEELERDVIQTRYYNKRKNSRLTVNEVAAELGKEPSEVSKAERTAINKMKITLSDFSSFL